MRYSRFYAWLILGLGALNVMLGLMNMSMGGRFSFSLILGVMFCFMGVLYFQRPYFMVEDGTIVIPALIGPVKRQFRIDSADDVRLDNGKIMINDGNRWKRVPVYRWISHPDDWSEMLKYIQSISAAA